MSTSSSAAVLRRAFLALSVVVLLFAGLYMTLSWLTQGQFSPLHDWTGFESWSGASINAYWGSRSPSVPGSPPLIFAVLAGLAILLYWLFCKVRSAGHRFDWRVTVTIFLTCWIALDLLWQARLFWQLSETQSSFAGKSYAEKLQASDDALLVHFATTIKEVVPDTRGRILVGSDSDYLGMRSAYFLYPYNVLWQRDGPEIPPRQYLRSGDHIALILPTNVQINVVDSALRIPGEAPIKVDPVLKHSAGYLFRVR